MENASFMKLVRFVGGVITILAAFALNWAKQEAKNQAEKPRPVRYEPGQLMPPSAPVLR